KVSETGAFVITSYIERDAVAVAELRDSVLVRLTGLVKLGLADKPYGRGSIRGTRPSESLRHLGASRTGRGYPVLRALGTGRIRAGVLLSVHTLSHQDPSLGTERGHFAYGTALTKAARARPRNLGSRSRCATS